VLRTQHSYDAAGRRIETVYPSGRVATYTHDADEVTGIAIDGETLISGAESQPFGPVSGWTWGDGDVHDREYDLDGRLTGQGLTNGSQPGEYRNLDYTVDDNIATITGPRLARNYGYDGLDRLIAANDPDRIDQYTYDPNGNRTSRTEGAHTETYTTETGSNRLLAISSNATTTDHAYDANGNLIDDGRHSYTYSARNRLTEVDGGDTARYRYNALGQRIRKQTGGAGGTDYARLAAEARQQADEYEAIARQLHDRADYWRGLIVEPTDDEGQIIQNNMYRTTAEAYETGADFAEAVAADFHQQADEYAAMAGSSSGQGSQYFVYNDHGRLIGRYDESGEAIREYFHLGPLPVAVAANDQLYYIHADHLGTPRAVSEPAGDVIWSWISAPFGDTEPNEDPDGDEEAFTLNLRFAGQYHDQETGKNYNHNRYYDPNGGRYITSDPIGLNGGLNTYLYVGANPLYWIDPTGLAAECIFTPLSFDYAASGQQREVITRRWDNTICGQVNRHEAPLPPDNPRRPRGRVRGLISPEWKCQTTYFKTGYLEELYKATAWGVLRCYDDCGELTDETYGPKRWESEDEWRKVEGSEFEGSRRGKIFP
jgi:RHS repeat-associated protein